MIKSEIVFSKDGEYDFNSVQEVVCMFICEVFDEGERYSKSSRYNYSFNGYSKSKTGFQFGTAKACIQSYILDKGKQNERFNINTFTPNGSNLKLTVVK